MEDRQLASIEIALSTGSRRPFFFRASSAADKGVIQQIFHEQTYNPSPYFLGQSLKEYANAIATSGASLLVVDAGANIGASAIYLTQLHPRIHVCAVEPELRNFSLLKTNCTGLPIIPIQAAVACEAGKLWLSDPGAGDWGFRVSRSVGQYEVEAITVNDILGRFDLQKYRPLICKIDIEGSEKDLFRANDTWIDQFPLIVIELHDWLLPGTSNSKTFLSAISKRNFDVICRGENMFCFNNDILSKFSPKSTNTIREPSLMEAPHQVETKTLDATSRRPQASMGGAVPVQGRFINLDRSPDRRASIEAQLRKLGLHETYKRFAAIDGENGQLACLRSHQVLLEQAPAGCAVHVLEDDAVLSGYISSVVENISSNGSLDQFDIIFTETLVAPDVSEIRELKKLFDSMRADEAFTVCNITGSYRACTSSYVVGPKSLRRVASVLKRGLDENLPIDPLIRQEAKKGHLTLGCVFPFVTTIQLNQPTAIRGRYDDRAQFSKKAIDLLRYSFFVDREFTQASSIIAAMEAKSDPHRELIERVLGLAASDQFVELYGA